MASSSDDSDIVRTTYVPPDDDSESWDLEMEVHLTRASAVSEELEVAWL